MVENVRAIAWEAPEHNHIEKTGDWYWILGILATAGSVASMIFNNVLFGIVILLGAMTMFITGNRKPRIIEFEVSASGIRIERDYYPYATLEAYFIDEESPLVSQLIVRSKKLLMPLLILPIPEEYTADIEHLVGARLIEEHMEEPFSHRVLEFLGF